VGLVGPTAKRYDKLAQGGNNAVDSWNGTDSSDGTGVDRNRYRSDRGLRNLDSRPIRDNRLPFWGEGCREGDVDLWIPVHLCRKGHSLVLQPYGFQPVADGPHAVDSVPHPRWISSRPQPAFARRRIREEEEGRDATTNR